MTSREFDPSKAIRKAGENDRSDEFKAGRKQFVTNVNDWLGVMHQKQLAGEPLSFANMSWPLQPTPRIIETILGRLGRNHHSKIRETTFGFSLTGDGVETPLELQAVRPSLTGTEVLVVKGSDPLERALQDGEYTGSQLDLVAGITIEDTDKQGGAKYIRFEVAADGSFHKRFLSPEGVHTSTSVTTEADIAMARIAFDQIKESIT